MQTLDQIIKNLENKPYVDAVFVTGSQGINEEKEYSDIDLGIILNTESDLQNVFQWVDDKPCDIYIFDSVYMKTLLTAKTISTNQREGLLINFFDNANIKFDKTGIISSLKEKIGELKKNLLVPESSKKSFEGIINIEYVTNNRYFQSKKPEYYEALEIKLPTAINNILVGYFNFRDIPWKGDKRVLKYLKENDLNFFNTYMKAIRANSVEEKFTAYTDLVKMVFTGKYSLWQKDVVRPFTKKPISDTEQEEFVRAWQKLIS